MAAGTILSNPLGAFSGAPKSNDYTTYLTKDDLPADYPRRGYWFRANAAVTIGQLCAHVVATSTAPLSVTPAATSQANLTVRGIAANSAAAGEMVFVIVEGFALALVEAGTTPAAGNAVVNGGTTAGSVGADTTVDGSDIVGTEIGIYLAAKLTSFNGSSNYAPVWLQRV